MSKNPIEATLTALSLDEASLCDSKNIEIAYGILRKLVAVAPSPELVDLEAFDRETAKACRVEPRQVAAICRRTIALMNFVSDSTVAPMCTEAGSPLPEMYFVGATAVISRMTDGARVGYVFEDDAVATALKAYFDLMSGTPSGGDPEAPDADNVGTGHVDQTRSSRKPTPKVPWEPVATAFVSFMRESIATGATGQMQVDVMAGVAMLQSDFPELSEDTAILVLRRASALMSFMAQVDPAEKYLNTGVGMLEMFKVAAEAEIVHDNPPHAEPREELREADVDLFLKRLRH